MPKAITADELYGTNFKASVVALFMSLLFIICSRGDVLEPWICRTTIRLEVFGPDGSIKELGKTKTLMQTVVNLSVLTFRQAVRSVLTLSSVRSLSSKPR